MRSGDAGEVAKPDSNRDGAPGTTGTAQASRHPIDQSGEHRIAVGTRPVASTERVLSTDRRSTSAGLDWSWIEVVGKGEQVTSDGLAGECDHGRLGQCGDLGRRVAQSTKTADDQKRLGDRDALHKWARVAKDLGHRHHASAPPIGVDTPKALTSELAAKTTPPVGDAPTATGWPRSDGSSRCSTDA